MRVDEENRMTWQDIEREMIVNVEDYDLDWNMRDGWDETDVEILQHRYLDQGPKLCVPRTNEALRLALEDPDHPAAAGIIRLQNRGLSHLRMEPSCVRPAPGCLYVRGEKNSPSNVSSVSVSNKQKYSTKV